MPDGSAASGGSTQFTYSTGDQLVFRVAAAGTQSACSVAEEVGHLAEAHELGSWSVAPIGVGFRHAYLDLELARDVDAVFLRLLIGIDPAVY